MKYESNGKPSKLFLQFDSRIIICTENKQQVIDTYNLVRIRREVFVYKIYYNILKPTPSKESWAFTSKYDVIFTSSKYVYRNFYRTLKNTLRGSYQEN